MKQFNEVTSLTDVQIKEIAEQLDCGFRCFWNKQTNELMFVPDTNRFPESGNEIFDEDIEKLDNNFGDYDEIESMQSSDSFEIMAEFAEQITDNNKLQRQLIFALNNKKPFSRFKNVIDNSGPYREEWFKFKNEKLKEWVMKKIAELS